MAKKAYITQSIVFLMCLGLSFLDYRHETVGIDSRWVKNWLIPPLQHLSAIVTDMKFRVRGSTPPKNPIVIVEIDGASIQALGRWPWRRDYMALLIDRIFERGAKIVAIDALFSEPQELIPEELGAQLSKQGMGALIERYDVDGTLEKVFKKYSDRLVLSWQSEAYCQPRFSQKEECPVDSPESLDSFPKGFERFSIFSSPLQVPSITKTPLFSAITATPNLARLNAVTRHLGFVNAFRDRDGLLRRTGLILLAKGKAYPSMPLELARRARGENLSLEFDPQSRIKTLSYRRSGKSIPVSPTGFLSVNFRGPAGTFPSVSAKDVISESQDRTLASTASASLKDAIVLLGVSALAVGDLVPTPLDALVPGVEVNANIVDNLLSLDPLPTLSKSDFLIQSLCLLMFAIVLGWGLVRWEIYPALAFSFMLLGILFFLDTQILFKHNRNYQTAFFYLQWIGVTMSTFLIKYVAEAQQKKFLRGAFSKYVAPSVVEALIRHPEGLSLGGRKEELTILFSDIRNFTTFSEKRDARLVSQFLNEYLDLMTELVFSTQGTLDKYIGDAIMAFWGAPLGQPDHASRACHAALKMIEVLNKNRSLFKEKYDLDLHIGIGVHTGNVSVGNLGSSKSFNYTVIGDNVNLTSRIEGMTKTLGVPLLTTRSTLEAMTKTESTQFGNPRELGKIRVKGREEAVNLVELTLARYSEEGLQIYEKARKLFLERAWSEASDHFKISARLLAIDGKEDGPSLYYLSKCKEMLTAPPDPKWEGTLWNIKNNKA